MITYSARTKSWGRSSSCPKDMGSYPECACIQCAYARVDTTCQVICSVITLHVPCCPWSAQTKRCFIGVFLLLSPSVSALETCCCCACIASATTGSSFAFIACWYTVCPDNQLCACKPWTDYVREDTHELRPADCWQRKAQDGNA